MRNESCAQLAGLKGLFGNFSPRATELYAISMGLQLAFHGADCPYKDSDVDFSVKELY